MTKLKRFLILNILSLCLAGNVNAQEVTVTGMGADRDSAIRDASQHAVEQVVGTFIDSRTLMENFVIQLDEVYKKSRGFVRNIQILNEGKVDPSTYRVKAKIDVDTEPNSSLINELTMLMQLNDPRIAVIILENAQNKISHNEFVESSLNQKLLEMGFTHVISSAQVIKLDNAQLLNNIYSGKQGLFLGKKDNATDFLVIGRCSKDARNVAIPNFGQTGMMKTALVNVKANLKIDVLKYDTGEIIGTFTTDGLGIENNSSRAGDKAVNIASDKAAEKLADTFKKFSMNVTQGLQFTITAADEKKLQQAINDLRAVGVVDNVQIREQKKNSAVMSVESAQKPHEIVAMLKRQTKLGIFVENITNSSCKLRVS